MMKWSKFVALGLAACMAFTSPIYPESSEQVLAAQDTEVSAKAANVTKHGTDRTRLVQKSETVSTPDPNYVIPQGTQMDAKEGKYNEYFLKDDIQTVSVTMNENNLNYLLQNAIDEPTVMTDSVTIGDTTLGYTGIKTKGNYTLAHTFTDYDSDRFSFTINFGKYIKKKKGYSANQTFYGVNKISFNNCFFDPTIMKEYNSFRLMDEMGLPTPQYGLARLYINGEYYGLYFMVEAIQSSILEQYYQTSSNNISDYFVKPSYYSPYYYSWDFENHKDPETGLITMDTLLNGGGLSKNSEGDYEATYPLRYYSGLWENDDDTLQDVAEMLPTVLNWEEKLTNLSNGLDFSGKQINVNSDRYLELLEQIMDVDEAIRYFATHSFIIQMDNLFTWRQNYTLYVDENGRSLLVPWDYDLGWGGNGEPSSSESIANWNIDYMYNDVAGPKLHISPEVFYKTFGGTGFPLFHVIFQNTELRNRFHTYMRDCAKITSLGGVTSTGEKFEAGRFYDTIMNDLYKKAWEAAKTDTMPDHVYYVGGLEQPTGVKYGVPNLARLIALRATGVWLQTKGIDSRVCGYGTDGAKLNIQTGKYSSTGNLTVVDAATGIFASATYAGNETVYPSLKVTSLSKNHAVYQSLMKSFRNITGGEDPELTVYQMTNTKKPSGDYTLYLPISTEKASIYTYSKSGEIATYLSPTVYDGTTYAVKTSDISYIAVVTNATKKTSQIMVNQIDLSKCTINLSKTSYVYDGTEKRPAVTVKNGGATVLPSSGYTVSYKNNINAGTATVTVKAKENSKCTGSKSITFSITKAVNTVKVDKTAITVNGTTNSQKVTIRAKAKSGALKYVSGNSKVKVSTAGVVTLPKNFYGTVTITVKSNTYINYTASSQKVTIRVPAPSYITSMQNSAKGKAKVSFRTQSGIGGYQIQYADNGWMKHAISRNLSSRSNSVTLSSLKTGKTYYVRIRTYVTVDGKKYYSKWSAIKKIKITK